MCGITGWLSPRLSATDAAPRLAAMRATIAHRGPDDFGDYLDQHVALGMQRLSIVDLAGGHQPMRSDDGRLHVVFNGEIYNHAALRAELAATGINCRTHSDTEVVLRLFERDGLAALARLNGMFAIAVWDAQAGRLTLVRDRLGVKPLYYAALPDGLVFGSEIKSLLASGAIAREIDRHALWDYLSFRYVPEPHTIWRGVRKLPPGHVLEIDRAAPTPRLRAWWTLPMEAPAVPSSDARYEETFATLFEDAVRLRMLADVPVGITLSGGLDSSAVAVAALRADVPLKTFTVAFADAPATDERVHARAVATALGTEHHEVEIGEREFMDFLPEFVWYSDEPLADLASVPLYFVSRLARREVKVVLSGEGSDEILAGYSFDERVAAWDATTASVAATPRGGWRQRARVLLGRAVPTSAPPDPLEPPPSMTNYWSSEEKRALLRDAQPWPDSLDRVRAQFARVAGESPLNRMLYSYCHDWLVEDLLMKADRMSMAASLELRTPFLDYRLVEFAARLPLALKVGRHAGGYRTKEILRRYAAPRLPAAILTRPKQGFPVPVYGWLSGSLRGWARDLLTAVDCRLLQWFDRAALATVVASGTATDAGQHERHRLWNLLILELWCRRWLGAAR